MSSVYRHRFRSFVQWFPGTNIPWALNALLIAEDVCGRKKIEHKVAFLFAHCWSLFSQHSSAYYRFLSKSILSFSPYDRIVDVHIRKIGLVFESALYFRSNKSYCFVVIAIMQMLSDRFLRNIYSDRRILVLILASFVNAVLARNIPIIAASFADKVACVEGRLLRMVALQVVDKFRKDIKEKQDQDACSICLEKNEPKEEQLSTHLPPGCFETYRGDFHIFHSRCINSWDKAKGCPVCRAVYREVIIKNFGELSFLRMRSAYAFISALSNISFIFVYYLIISFVNSLFIYSWMRGMCMKKQLPFLELFSLVLRNKI